MGWDKMGWDGGAIGQLVSVPPAGRTQSEHG